MLYDTRKVCSVVIHYLYVNLIGLADDKFVMSLNFYLVLASVKEIYNSLSKPV